MSRPRPDKLELQQSLGCPRCDSTNTKFCYYNNYSLSQPRFFCKACRRYWTHGGSLRNVPVGGACRRKNNNNNKNKNKRSSSSSYSKLKSSKKLQERTKPSNPPLLIPLPPPLSYELSDIGFASSLHNPSGSSNSNNTFLVPSLNPSSINPAAGLLDIILSSRSSSSSNAGLYYGFGGTAVGEVECGGGGGGVMMLLPFDGGSTEAVTTTTTAATAAAAAATSTGKASSSCGTGKLQAIVDGAAAAEQLVMVQQQWPAIVGGGGEGDHAATTANDLEAVVDPMLIRDNYYWNDIGSTVGWHGGGLNQHLSNYVEY